MATKQYSYCVYNVVRPTSRPCYTDTFHDDNNIHVVTVHTTSSVLITLTSSIMTQQYSYCVYKVVRPNSRPYNTDTFHDDKTI
jgi:hypothetical protein